MYRVLLICYDDALRARFTKYVGNVNHEIGFKTAEGVEQAVEALSADPGIDVVVCEQSADMDGPAASSEISGSVADVRPFILTGESPDGDLALRAFDSPVDVYLSRRGSPDFFVRLAQQIVLLAEKRRTDLRHRRTMDRLNAITRLIEMKGRPFNEILEYALETSVSITGSTAGYIAVYDSFRRVLRMIAWSMGAMKQCDVQNVRMEYELDGTGVWGDPIRTMKPVIINDYEGDTVHHKKGTPVGHMPLHRLLMVPIIRNGVPVATAGVGNKAEDYDEEDQEQLSLLMGGLVSIYEENLFRQPSEEGSLSLRKFLSKVPYGAFYLMTDTRFVYCNDSAKRLLELTDRDVLEGSMKTCETDGCAAVLNAINDIKNDEEGTAKWSMSLGGASVRAIAAVSKVLDDAGRLTGYAGGVIDVTRLMSSRAVDPNLLAELHKTYRHTIRSLEAIEGRISDAMSPAGKGRDVALAAACDACKKVASYLDELSAVGEGAQRWVKLSDCLPKSPEGLVVAATVGGTRVLADPAIPRVFELLEEYSSRRQATAVRIDAEEKGDRLQITYVDDGDSVPSAYIGMLFTGHTSEGLWTVLLERIVKASGFSISDRGSGYQGLVVTIEVPNGRFSAI